MKAFCNTVAIAVISVAAAGCASAPAQNVGCAAPNYGAAVVGGLAGGLLGSQVGRGSGRLAATAVGAGTGAVIGSQVGCE